MAIYYSGPRTPTRSHRAHVSDTHGDSGSWHPHPAEGPADVNRGPARCHGVRGGHPERQGCARHAVGHGCGRVG